MRRVSIGNGPGTVTLGALAIKSAVNGGVPEIRAASFDRPRLRDGERAFAQAGWRAGDVTPSPRRGRNQP